jgi:hypothetical protein
LTAEQEPQRPQRPDALRLLTAFGSPIALGSVLMLYFGWARSEAQARRFGADASVFEMSTQDLILRSVDALFMPIILLLLGSLALVRFEPWLRDRASWLAPVLRHAWVLVPVGLLLRAATEEIGDILLPFWVLLAVGGTAYSVVLRRQLSGDRSPLRFSAVVLVVLLLVAILFWQTERVAVFTGEVRADEIMRDLDCKLPVATLFTTGRLHIEAPDVTETRIEGPEESTFRYRYEGLHFLQRSGDKYFLLTDGWTDGEGRLVLVPDSQDVRLEFGASQPPPVTCVRR